MNCINIANFFHCAPPPPNWIPSDAIDQQDYRIEAVLVNIPNTLKGIPRIISSNWIVIEPIEGATSHRFDTDPSLREDGVAAQCHVAQVDHEGGDPGATKRLWASFPYP